MFRLKYILLLLALFLLGKVDAQDFKLSGLLVNQGDNSSLPGATVKLMNLRDTLNVKYATSE